MPFSCAEFRRKIYRQIKRNKFVSENKFEVEIMQQRENVKTEGRRGGNLQRLLIVNISLVTRRLDVLTTTASCCCWLAELKLRWTTKNVLDMTLVCELKEKTFPKPFLDVSKNLI